MGLLECCLLHPVTSMHIGGRRQTVGRSLLGCRPGVGRASADLLIVDRISDGAGPYVERARLTHVSVLTGAGRLVQRASPELHPKCDRVDFKQKIRSTPGRIWNSATFGRSTNSAGDSWICDVGIRRLLRALLLSTQEFVLNFVAVTWSAWQSWGIYGCYRVYVVLTGRLSCTSRNSHAHWRTYTVCI